MENRKAIIDRMINETTIRPEGSAITAHSGCDNTPDDSLESVAQGIESGADIVEVDVRMNRDGVLVLSHDSEPGRYYSDLPALEAAFEIIQAVEGIGINCDVKEALAIPAVLDLTNRLRFPRERLYLSGSVTPEVLRNISDLPRRCHVLWNLEEMLRPLAEEKLRADGREELLPVLSSDPWRALREIMPDPDPYAGDVVRLAKTFAIETLNIPWQIATEERISFFRQHGLEMSVWTVNEPEQIMKYLRAGVPNITTRNAKVAVQLKTQFLTQQSAKILPRGTGAVL